MKTRICYESSSSIHHKLYVCMPVCIYVSMYVCIYVWMYVCMYVSLYVCMYVCVELGINILLCVRTVLFLSVFSPLKFVSFAHFMIKGLSPKTTHSKTDRRAIQASRSGSGNLLTSPNFILVSFFAMHFHTCVILFHFMMILLLFYRAL